MSIYILLGLVIFYYFLHSFLAYPTIKSFLSDHVISRKYYRLFYNSISVVLLFPILFIYQNIEANLLFVNTLFSKIGLVVIGFGVILLILALKQYDLSEFLGTQQLNPDSKAPILITNGMNNWVRHPLYFAVLVLMLGWFLFTPLDKVLVIGIVSIIYILIGAKLEERKLEETFGESYKKYKKEVPMLIPINRNGFTIDDTD